MKRSAPHLLLALAVPMLAAPAVGLAQQASMSFFVTSANPGKGADFGGLEGADKFCQSLAAAAGAGAKTWHAYLSTTATSSSPAVNARDRIGKGPWQNAQGVVVAKDLAELHGTNNINKQTALTEKGGTVKGRGDEPNEHDILTGSQADGTVATGGNDTTCGNWTKSGDGSAIVGHVDRTGTNPDPVKNVSWNSSHGTQGCSVDLLKKTGSAGYLYCFATN
jgi:hypothetical protein